MANLADTTQNDLPADIVQHMSEEVSELAYYYPEPFWRMTDGDALKNLLLFFDGIAILLPRYMTGRETAADPVLAGSLKESGLLRVFEPEVFVDQEVTEKLLTTMTELITSGAFDDLKREVPYAELSRSRMGWNADVELSQMITDELIGRNLARPSDDGVSIPLHPAVRTTFLILLSQLARDAGRRQGLTLHPSTANSRALTDLMSVLSLPAAPSAGHVVALDLEVVGLNLSSVPVDEILEYKRTHGQAHKAYARNVRQNIAELALLDAEEREAALLDRREELADQANDLRKMANRAWRRPLAGFALGAVGAAWTVINQNDPLGAILALAGVSMGLSFSKPTATAYSYVLNANQALGARSGSEIQGWY